MTTEHYNLTCPSATDYYNIAVHNENMEKIDTAIAAAVNVGSYFGDGAAERSVSLPRTPKFVLVLQNGSELNRSDQGTSQCGGLAVTGAPAVMGDTCLEITEGGFRVTHGTVSDNANIRLRLNTTGEQYSYVWG